MRTILATTILASVISTSAFAADAVIAYEEPVAPQPSASRFVGHLGLGGGWLWVQREEDSGDEDDFAFGSLDASVAARINEWMIGVEGWVRYDDFASAPDFDSDEDPAWTAAITGHVLYDFTPSFRFGGFAQYGDTWSQGSPRDDDYNIYLVGLTAQTMVTEDLLVFGQVAFGDKIRDGDSLTGGFIDGYALRAGATYFVSDWTGITLDAEYSAADPYIDGDEKGRFYSVSLSGESRLTETMPLFANYGVSYTRIDGTTENDYADEVGVFAGLKWTFGQETVRDRWTNGLAIGAPKTPVRASAWKENLD